MWLDVYRHAHSRGSSHSCLIWKSTWYAQSKTEWRWCSLFVFVFLNTDITCNEMFTLSHTDLKRKPKNQNLFHKERLSPTCPWLCCQDHCLTHVWCYIFPWSLMGAKHRNFNSFRSPTPVSILETYGQIYGWVLQRSLLHKATISVE